MTCESCKAGSGCGMPPTAVYEADGLFVAQIEIQRAGEKIAQHAHVYPHLTMLTHGSVRVHCSGQPDRDFTAPVGFTVEAFTKHQFTALTDDVFLLCIHNTGHSGRLETARRATVEDLR